MLIYMCACGLSFCENQNIKKESRFSKLPWVVCVCVCVCVCVYMCAKARGQPQVLFLR